MTVQEEVMAVIAEAKAWRWTPELFERIRALLSYTDVFNILRRELTPVEYEQFDLEYCSHIRPQDRELTKWLTEKRKVSECKSKEKASMMKKPQSKQGEAEQHRKNLTREYVSSQILKW